VDSWEIFGRRTWTAWGVFEELFLDAVAVAGQYDQLERDRGCGETSGFEVACVQLHCAGGGHPPVARGGAVRTSRNQRRSWVVYACRVPGDESLVTNATAAQLARSCSPATGRTRVDVVMEDFLCCAASRREGSHDP
jgi:hypothetical protein